MEICGKCGFLVPAAPGEQSATCHANPPAVGFVPVSNGLRQGIQAIAAFPPVKHDAPGCSLFKAVAYSREPAGSLADLVCEPSEHG